MDCVAHRTRYDMARLSVSASGLLGHYKYCKEKSGQLDREYRSCKERKGQLDSERAYGREELRRIRSVVNTYIETYSLYLEEEGWESMLRNVHQHNLAAGRLLKICQV